MCCLQAFEYAIMGANDEHCAFLLILCVADVMLLCIICVIFILSRTHDIGHRFSSNIFVFKTLDEILL